MKRRYQLLLIILIGSLLTLLINALTPSKQKTLVALGDSLSIGTTAYNTIGTSFNDYLKEELNYSLYNYEYAIDNLTIEDLNNYIKNNYTGKKTGTPIKQTLEDASLITIAIGMDELSYKVNETDFNTDIIANFLNEYESLLLSIRKFYNDKIIVIGLYPTDTLSKSDILDINKNLNMLCSKYNAIFIDIFDLSLNQDYFLKKNSYHLNYLAHQKITNLITQKLKQD
jgi:lysophospholipase L1-like esterase